MSSKSCDYIKREGLNLSDGSDLTANQPLLKATDWFLTEEEITRSRGGSPRSDLATYSTGNNVTTYTVSKEFFDGAFTDLSATGERDCVMLSGWSTNLIPFQPDVDNDNKSTFLDVFSGVIHRGGSIHALVWANLLEKSQNIAVRDDINSIPAFPTTGEKAVFIFDDRTRTATSSHHQKSLVIASANSTSGDDHPIAFVGGVDITSDRWDTIYHNESALREAIGINAVTKGWLDAHVRIHGPAAKDVAANFLSRWNADYLPTQSLADHLLEFKNPAYTDLPVLSYTSSNTSSKLGHQNVQIVRTFSCKYKHHNEFAPHGEDSHFQARLKAIRTAKNFIYIEDQYFVLVPELQDAILKMMPTIQRLIVVVQRPGAELKATGYEKYVFDMVAPIQQLYPNKFQMDTTKSDLNLYIHTKVVVIDDIYLSVGSANWNRRSMTSDSEIGANIVDDLKVESPGDITVLKTARDFRISKFREMTGLSYVELDAMTFVNAANRFDAAAADKASLIDAFQVEEHVYFKTFTDAVRETVDPQDTCRALSSD